MKKSLIVVAVLLIAAFGGWFGYAQNKDNNQKNKSAQTTPADPTEGGKYLVIKEWGVRMKLNDKIKDAKYKFGDSPNGIYLSTESVEKVSGCEIGHILGLERAKKGESLGPTIADDPSPGPNKVNPFIKIDDYYYLETGPSFSCANENDISGKAVLGQARVGYSEAWRLLEKIPSK